MNHNVNKYRKKPLHVLKFGGTSVGDSSCILAVGEIIRRNLRSADLVVVVSAMSGVTNRLLEAAKRSSARDTRAAEAILASIRDQHIATATQLITSDDRRKDLLQRLNALLDEGARLCDRVSRLGALTAEATDSIASLGERLSAPVIASTLTEHGVNSVAVEATELIVTDSSHGAAAPLREPTRMRSKERLDPLIRGGAVPVVTGFIGATTTGAVTTLGRGGSDYSATILAAALDADEVSIWTDVDGLMTADPRWVAGARTISDISYREAAELAHFGAKVLHPRTVQALVGSGIPLWIRNTFAPDRPGTKITPSSAATDQVVKGVTAIRDVTIVSIKGKQIGGSDCFLARSSKVAERFRGNLPLLQQSISEGCIRLAVPSDRAAAMVAALRLEFAAELAAKTMQGITLDPPAGIVTLVGNRIHAERVAERSLEAIRRAGVLGLAVSEATGSEYNFSLAVLNEELKTVLNLLHHEFGLDAPVHPGSNAYLESTGDRLASGARELF